MKALKICMGFMLLASTAIGQGNSARVNGGDFLPLYGNKEKVEIQSFFMDVYPVTNADFLEFVRKNPRWRKSEVKAIFADDKYLNTWESDLDFGNNHPDAPVTNVSWYAAKNYCECLGKRLPTVDEWEYAAMASEIKPDAREEESFNKKILRWYETPETFKRPVGTSFKNYWGIYDLHGLVWEWTLDFNSVLITGESRQDSTGGNDRFCGAAAVGATDLMNYAAFMRYAFRGSMKASYNIKNLGFRCVQDAPTDSLNVKS